MFAKGLSGTMYFDGSFIDGCSIYKVKTFSADVIVRRIVSRETLERRKIGNLVCCEPIHVLDLLSEQGQIPVSSVDET
jgi:hypothetical protein